MQNKVDKDLIIVGAGIVGLTLAGLLAHSQLHIAIVDTKLPVQPESDAWEDAGEFNFKVYFYCRIMSWLDCMSKRINFYYISARTDIFILKS